MTFDEVLDQVRELLQQRGRVTYRSLKLRYQLDEESLAGITDELIKAERVAADEDGEVLVWTGKEREKETEKQRIGESERGPIVSANARRQTLDPRSTAGERRQLTVMFCDLVGSTALSTQLDPEELREVIRAYRETCATVIRRFDGYLAKYIGDGLLVYFGYPVAHEDDAQRAVRAGLGIVGAMQSMPLQHFRLPHPLQVRLGIHTGLVVAGEMGVGDQPEPLAIVGETPNLAARLQENALPNSVVISASTARLVTGLFEFHDLGPQTLKGITTPMSAYRVLQESEAQSRFEVAVRTGLTPLVGRAEDLALLQRRWEQAKRGAGQVVLLSGEPGIGKSRLVQEFKEQLAPEGVTRIEFRCSPYHQNSALYPIIEHLQRLLQFAREDLPATKLEKLQHTLSRYHFPQADTLPLLASLLSLPHPEGYPPITLSPQKQKEKTQAALVAWLVEEAEQTTVYTIWEDVHWADPSTLEVVTLVVDQAPTARFYVLLTFRPEFSPPWGNRSHVSQLTLSRLGRPQVKAMIEQVTGGKALPPEVMQQIIAKTDGVPLFVEELTKTVVESGLLAAVDGRYELHGLLPPLAIPSTLHDSLMARLDRLASVREIAQLGATLGREFSYELLQAVSSLDDVTLQQGLKQLVEAELVYQRGLGPQAHYLFKHALIQDTAYQSLLKSTRQQYHRQIAQVLAERFPETIETQPELVAHHYTEAGLIAQAIPYWQQAGRRAAERSAYVEAIEHLTKGLELLKTLPNTPERTQQELGLQLTLGIPLSATRGYAAPEVAQTYMRAQELCQRMGETPQLIPVLLGLWRFYLLRAELAKARELAEQCLLLVQRVDDPTRLIVAHDALGETLFFLGDFAQARAHLERAVALYDPQKRRPHHALTDPGVSSLSMLAGTLWMLGYPEQARQKSTEAQHLAEALVHPHILASTLIIATHVHQLRQEVRTTQARAEAVVTLATEQGFLFWLAEATIFVGWALAVQGRGAEGIAQIHHGLATRQAIGLELTQPVYLTMLAEAYESVGQPTEGLTVLADALTRVDTTGERWREVELHWLRGELLLAVSAENHREAEACFRQALTIAHQQQAKSLELRTAISLSRLWQQQGKKTEAHRLLSEIYNWFTEGFDTKDLQEAKALLEELT
jgi:class 3 adenylate cyclase/predicted ATPase